MVEEINEPVDVMTVFREGCIRPVKFKWTGRTFSVQRVAYRWVTREGSYPVHHFSVLCENKEVYELAFNTYTLSWTLARIHLPG